MTRRPEDQLVRRYAEMERRLAALENHQHPPQRITTAEAVAAGAVEVARCLWTNATIVNNASPVELVCDTVVPLLGDCVEIVSNRATFKKTGIYFASIAGSGSFTPSANGRVVMNVDFVDSGASTALSGAAASVPLIASVTNTVNVVFARSEWSDVGGFLKVEMFQVSGANRLLSADGEIWFLGEADYPY
jgi:hypothetical protein